MARRGRSSSPRAEPTGRGIPARTQRSAAAGDMLYGRNPVREALRAGRREVREVWARRSVAREPWLAGLAVAETGPEQLAALCGSPDHQGVCARVAPYPYAEADALLAGESPLIVALDEVQDPQNLGAICRTAECAGATGVVVPERRSAEVTPAVAKASAGAVEHLRVARVRNLADFLAEAKHAGCWCYGASADGDTPYGRPDFRGGVVMVLGSEGHGLRPRVAAACDALVALPVRGRVASLNVGAVAAVLLYEILQSRQEVVDSGP
jgi:23S rRNA (guanosine2251-2'-O)-methyltransferase